MPDRSATPRGFAVYDEFTDTYGARIRVQKSSSAEGPRVWIFAGHPEVKLRSDYRERLARAGFTTPAQLAELAAMLEPSPHLNVEQAKRTVAALNEFIAEHDDVNPVAEPREDGRRD